MLYTAPATVTDKPSTLNMQGFWGNDLHIRFEVPGAVPMPTTVDVVALYANSTRPLAEALQPSVTVDGRAIIVAFTDTKRYQFLGRQQLVWNGRVVASGTLQFSQDTTANPGATLNTVSINLTGGVVVAVDVLIGASAGGIPPDLIDAPDFLNVYTLFKNA